MNLLFNPIYCLKPDDGRILLMHRGGLQSTENQHSEEFFGYIHPVHAIILSFVDGSEYSDIVKRIKEYINIDEAFIKSFIDKLIECDHPQGFSYSGSFLSFPAKTIICSNKKRDITYDPDIFLLDKLDLRQKRHKTVSKLTLMINNKCKTNCYYCYADKRNPINCLIKYERLCEIIKEAHDLNVVNIDLIGGEVFLYPRWKDLILELLKYHYNPLLSTKIPLEEEDVKFLATTKLPLQVSLDSLLPETLKSILGVNDNYIIKLKEMFSFLQKHQVKVAVHTIVTQRNSTVENMQSVYDFLSKFDNILYWKPDLGGESMYVNPEVKGTIEPSKESLSKLISYFKEIKHACQFPLIAEGLNDEDESDETTSATESEKVTGFLNRALCTGNFSQLFILPDGKVTICEELYWHPRFIVGDINKQGLQEIWESEKALSLYNIKQDELSEKSACKTCGLFSECRELKQVCYRDIIRKYGFEHWDYADAKCPIPNEQ